MLFSERPIASSPARPAPLQIRGAVAEYERVLTTDRMRRGRLAKLRAGQLLPWSRPPYGYQVDPHTRVSPPRVQFDAITSVIVQQIFAFYLEPQATLYQVALRLSTTRVPTPTGKQRWTTATSATCSLIRLYDHVCQSDARSPSSPAEIRPAAARTAYQLCPAPG